MHRFVSLVRRFRRDERGAFGIIFAMLAIVLVAVSGAAVDFTSMQQARTKAQVALDAAALALQPDIYTFSTGTLKDDAQALLLDRLTDTPKWNDCTKVTNTPPCVTVLTPVVDTVNGQLSLTANIVVPMNFVSLVGVPTLQVQILSVATRKKLSLEVAMVLDNSGSMGTTMGSGSSAHTRMYNLQASANCAANILFYNVTTCSASTTGQTLNTNTKMAVVPFTSAVNVGTANATASWIDRTGTGNISDNNFDTDDDPSNAFNGPVDRIGLFSQMSYSGTALSWGGCVEARYNNGGSKQYDTDDTTPDTAQPDTLFTPYFAPDEPGGSNNPQANPPQYNNDITGQYFYDSYIADGTASAQCNRTGTCAQTATAPVTYSTTTVITKTTYTTTIKNKLGKTTAGPTTSTITQTVGPSNGSTSTGSSTTTSATITTSSGATRTAAGICTCNGAGATGTTNGSASTNGSVSKNTVNGTLPKDTTSTDASGNVTTVHYTAVTVETDLQPMKYTATTAYSCTGASYSPWTYATQASGGLTAKALQERLCKYTGAVLSYPVNQGSVYGPNGDCPFNPITPLTATPATITTAVNAMSPQGATNIAEGAAWGFRVLSPTAPFTEGAPYAQATSKVMIIMTDGENTRYPDTYMNDAQFYSPYGYPTNTTGRLGTATTDAHTLEQRVNDRLSAVCTNAKAQGITVYTIGLATSATDYPSENTTLLTNCASESDYAYFPTSASDLQAAFVSIANQLAALRLAK